METKRLRLRAFTKQDIPALHLLLQDPEVNTFLPWFPSESIEETRIFYQEKIEHCPYAYVICLKTDPMPIGYIKVKMDDSYDLGYALRKEYWHKGFTTEAGQAVIERLKNLGVP